MEKDKRKRSHNNGEVDGRRTKSKEGKGDLTTADQRAPLPAATPTATATEEEVEEFFAILRRVREVVRYFGKGKNGDGEAVAAAAAAAAAAATKVSGGGGKGWNPSFQWEDFEDFRQGNNKQDGVVVVSNEGNKIKIKGRGGGGGGGAEKKDVDENPVRTLDLNAEPDSSLAEPEMN